MQVLIDSTEDKTLMNSSHTVHLYSMRVLGL